MAEPTFALVDSEEIGTSALPRNLCVEHCIGKELRTCGIGSLVASAASPRARSDEPACEPPE